MTKTNYIERVNGFIVPYLGKKGYTLIKTEFVSEDNNWYLRLFIDLSEEELAKRTAKLKEEQEAEDTLEADASAADETASGNEDAGTETEAQAGDGEETVPGVSINDCVKVSRYLSKWLDKEDFIKEVYTMEVCSRGFLNEGQMSAEIEGESK